MTLPEIASRDADRAAESAGHPPLRPLELAVLWHLGLFLAFASWGLGGNAPAPRLLLLAWGTLGMVLTFVALLQPESRAADRRRVRTWLWPWVLLNVVVLASLFNPSFRSIPFGSETLLVRTEGLANFPSSARPALSFRALWLFDGLFLSCFNLALVVRQRRALRGLLALVALNGLLLAIFGTLQKLSGAHGLFFNLIHSPQQFFFASFIYHNHWGAFAVLMVAICLGLCARYARRGHYRDFWHSPVFAGLVATFFIVASVPLSLSRSCTALVLVLLFAAFSHWAARLFRRRQSGGGPIVQQLTGAMLSLLVATAALYWLASSAIQQRVEKTREQVAAMQSSRGIGSRATLYHDTWRMARAKLPFGWGMGSYPTVFYLYNTQVSRADGLPVFYEDAHCDWLQAVAELGLVGAALLAAHALLPLWALRRRDVRRPLPLYLLAGCALIALYAGIEFPFGNPAVVLAWWFCFFSAVTYLRLPSTSEAT
jgi:O-antigen ligase